MIHCATLFFFEGVGTAWQFLLRAWGQEPAWKQQWGGGITRGLAALGWDGGWRVRGGEGALVRRDERRHVRSGRRGWREGSKSPEKRKPRFPQKCLENPSLGGKLEVVLLRPGFVKFLIGPSFRWGEGRTPPISLYLEAWGGAGVKKNIIFRESAFGVTGTTGRVGCSVKGKPGPVTGGRRQFFGGSCGRFGRADGRTALFPPDAVGPPGDPPPCPAPGRIGRLGGRPGGGGWRAAPRRRVGQRPRGGALLSLHRQGGGAGAWRPPPGFRVSGGPARDFIQILSRRKQRCQANRRVRVPGSFPKLKMQCKLRRWPQHGF